MKFKAPAPPYLGPAAHSSAGSNQPIYRIVIHSTVSPCQAGQARATAAYFRDPKSGGSAHYVVDPSEAVQVVWDDTIAWHAPPNQHSIGVELCDMPGRDEQHKAPPRRWKDKSHAAMLDRAAELVAQLCLAYDVPIRKIGPRQLRGGAHGICGHVDVSQAWHQSSHWDPGHFPWGDFIAAVQAKADAMRAAARKPAPKPAAKPKPAPKPEPAPLLPVNEQAAHRIRSTARKTRRPRVRNLLRSIANRLVGKK